MDFSNITIHGDTIITIGRGAPAYYPYPGKLMVSKFDFSGQHLNLLMENGDSLINYLPYYGKSIYVNGEKMLIVGGAGGYYANDMGFAAVVENFSSFNWVRFYEPVDTSISFRLVNGLILEDNNFIFLGLKRLVNGPTQLPYNGVLIKTDDLGNIIWEKNCENQSSVHSYKVGILFQESDSTFLIGSRRYNNSQDFRSTLQRINLNGELIYEWNNDNNKTYSPRKILRTSDGGLLFVCKYRKETTVDNFPLWQGYICKLDSTFNKEWELKLGHRSYGTYFLNMTQTYDGNYIAVGTVLDTFQTEGIWRQKGWLVKFDESGNVLWDRKIYSNADNYSTITDIVEADDHSLLACGLSQSYNEDYPQRGWLLKLDEWGCLDSEWCGPNTVYEEQGASSGVVISPNPASNYFRISFSQKEELSHFADDLIQKITVYNLVGEKMFDAKYDGVTFAEIETENWPSGMYVVMVNDVISGKVFVEGR